jgi:hypothetical protein
MKLKRISIDLKPSWDDNAGKYESEIEYEGHKGTIKLLLNPDVSNALLVCVGNVITEFSARAASELNANILASVEEARRPAITQEAAA